MKTLDDVKSFYSTYNNGHIIYDCNKKIVEVVNGVNPLGVLEFGCGTGKNLNLIDAISRVGIDLSFFAIEEGKSVYGGVLLFSADEKFLDNYSENAFDVSFTVSVLNHIPSPECEQIVNELKRISKKIFIMESLDKWTDLCFPHDYEKMGFEADGYEWISPLSRAVYKLYKWEK